MESHTLRSEFLNFFQKNKHKILPSFSLIPVGDPTILLINAGMAPMKSYFLGKENPPSKRIATSQKCVRVIDIEKVGKTVRHLTFFEMLGNFSFGDYFKEDAICFAWEFLTEVMKIPKEKLYVSIYYDDEEAYNIWKKEIDIKEDRIYRFGEEDNFWSAGDTGPCGPDSEIFIDLGEEFGCKSENCKVGCNCDRFIELWNLVFMQYNRDENKKLNPLPKKNIDTGMGLERLAMIKQEVSSPYETDLFKPIIDYLSELSGINFYKDLKYKLSFKIISDHIRAITFLISDGIIPSNEGRGYVLRRLIRRAYHFGKKLGLKKIFLHKLVPSVVRINKSSFPELIKNQDYIFQVVKTEEEHFQRTLDRGLEILQEIIEKIRKQEKKILSGEEVFKLYDTYGFPKELVEEIIKEENFEIDKKGFEIEMEKQKQRAREATKKDEKDIKLNLELFNNISTEFIGYENEKTESQIIAIWKDNNLQNEINENEEGEIILDVTPFYAEKGGEIGDTGKILKENNEIEILDTQSPRENLIFHKGKVIKGKFKKGDKIIAKIDINKRQEICRHHTATHLLHSALRKVLGEQVKQSGSLVSNEKLRFDFPYFKALKKEEIEKIEEIVNKKILQNLKTEIYKTSLDAAKKEGAVALFGEKYGEEVRVVKINDFSKELCGGCHVKNTGEIGLFKIISEESIGSGLRRIEAIVGESLYNYFKRQNEIIREISLLLKTPDEQISKRVKEIIEENKEKDLKISQQTEDYLKIKAEDANKNKVLINIDNKEIIYLMYVLEDIDKENVRKFNDLVVKNSNNFACITASITKNSGVYIFGSMSESLNKMGYDIRRPLKSLSKYLGGNAGGNPTTAQGGGKNIKSVREIRETGWKYLKEEIEKK